MAVFFHQILRCRIRRTNSLPFMTGLVHAKFSLDSGKSFFLRTSQGLAKGNFHLEIVDSMGVFYIHLETRTRYTSHVQLICNLHGTLCVNLQRRIPDECSIKICCLKLCFLFDGTLCCYFAAFFQANRGSGLTRHLLSPTRCQPPPTSHQPSKDESQLPTDILPPPPLMRHPHPV